MEQRRPRSPEARGAIWFASGRPRAPPPDRARRRFAPNCRSAAPARRHRTAAAQCVALLVVGALLAVSLGWHTRFEASTHLVGRLRSIVRPAPSLLILVHSAPGRAAERDAIRRAWRRSAADVISAHAARARTLFVVPLRARLGGGGAEGGTEGGAESQSLRRDAAALERERALHSDLLLIPSSARTSAAPSTDAFELLSALRWAVGVAPLRGASAPPYGWRSVLITRDDAFINTPYLVAALDSLPSEHFIMGNLPARTPKSRPVAAHPDSAAFVVSRDVVHSVVMTSTVVPLLSPSSAIGASFGVRRAWSSPYHR